MSNVDYELWTIYKHNIDEITSHKFNVKRRRQQHKLQRIIEKQTNMIANQHIHPIDTQQNHQPEYIDDFFINESSHQFCEEELKFLNKGLNFIPKPNKPPTLDIVAEIETAIKRLPISEKEFIRHECTKVIKAEKHKKKKADQGQTKVLEKLKTKDVFYIKADKSNSIVAVDVADYYERMDTLIAEGPYEEINFNPLNKMTNAVRTTLSNIKSKYDTSFETNFKVSNPQVPKLYGSPKTHKPGKKMRPITSNNNASTEKVAKWLVQEFNNLPDPPTVVKNCFSYV
jgi:hypothetical protein